MNSLKEFSPKQMRILTWWCPASPFRSKDAIICDGAVRSGKTMCMFLSFLCWLSLNFNEQSFVICGKTISSINRNVITPMLSYVASLGFLIEIKTSKNYMDVTYKNNVNRIYLFGGKDESSSSLIQGITLAGVMFDEVALMPRSFVEQALARCSVVGSKFWFNCNPEHPFHWFYLEWIQKTDEKNALYLHFLMQDNPSLSKKMLRRYQSLYSGAFYDRFVLGEWSAQSGVVYPMFNPKIHIVSKADEHFEQYYISCDYGITNPMSMGLWGRGKISYRIREYYYDSKREQAHRTDEEYYQALEELAGETTIQAVVVDPSATSFMECVRRHGKFKVIPADNNVNQGISNVSDMLKEEKLLFSPECKDSIREFSLYCWDENSRQDQVKKANDHAMDDIRYFVNTVLHKREDSFFVLASSR